ncbi:MAG: nitrogen regulation protein NR(II), partial [Dehalococcoidia bacterium]
MSQLPVEKQRCSPVSDLEKTIEVMPVWVQICALDGTIELVNSAALRLSGYSLEEITGQHWPYSWLSGPWSEGVSSPFEELQRNGSVAEFEGYCQTKAGHRVALEIALSLLPEEAGAPKRAIMVAWDLTQRNSKQADLGQAQKIQAVSQLASGVAHDINNNLAVILGYAEFLLSTSESFGDVVRQALSAIQEQSIECANTVRRIQLFSKAVSPSQFSGVSVNEVIQEVIEASIPEIQIPERPSGTEIELETELAELPSVNAYQSGLREALLAVMHNAVEALPKGGTVTCVTKCQDDQVVIEIKDNGVGVAAVDQNRVFDAFFTTKGPASSGLGLSIAYNLITQQGGTISLASQEGHGTTCTSRVSPTSRSR